MVIVLAGRYLMRPLFRFIATTGIREIFVGLALLIVVGITLLMQFVGLSAALGTFLAGVVLAEAFVAMPFLVITLEGAFLAGLIAGPYAGALVGLMVAAPAGAGDRAQGRQG